MASNLVREENQLTVKNGKLSHAEIEALFELTTANHAARHSTTFSAWPVPATNGLVNLRFPTLQEHIIRVREITGRVVLTRKSAGQETVLNLNQLPSGVYAVPVATGDVVEARKIVR